MNSWHKVRIELSPMPLHPLKFPINITFKKRGMSVEWKTSVISSEQRGRREMICSFTSIFFFLQTYHFFVIGNTLCWFTPSVKPFILLYRLHQLWWDIPYHSEKSLESSGDPRKLEIKIYDESSSYMYIYMKLHRRVGSRYKNSFRKEKRKKGKVFSHVPGF